MKHPLLTNMRYDMFRPRALVLCFAFVLFCWKAEHAIAHETNVHFAISEWAAIHSDGLTGFLKDVFGPENGDYPIKPLFQTYEGYFESHRLLFGSALGWITHGAVREDDGARPLNHFYDPITNLGITDHSEGPSIFGYQGYSHSSFTWASIRNIDGFFSQNLETWQNARDYEFTALTASSKIDREKNFAHAFASVGKVIHLIQDLSQPGHTRNDNHANEKHRYIENYGRDNYGSSKFPDSAKVAALDWQAAGFTKLQDFWDRGFYTGASSAPLNNDNGQQTLGLAEFSSGNFLSEDRLYKEVTGSSPRFPSLIDSTNYPDLNTNPAGAARQELLRDGLGAWRIPISKNADGIAVQNHAVLSFLGYKTTKVFGKVYQLGVSINDEKVLSEYHSLLIPKAVAYTGGAINYFFRGKLNLRITWDENQSRYNLQIANASTQAFKGGAFTLYSDDQNGNRSAVALTMNAPWSAQSTLASGASVQATFQAPGGALAGYMLVYKGTIGLDGNGNAADPVDAGIAIAAHEFKILRFNIQWNPVSDIDLYLVDPNGAIIWYGNKTSALGELDIDNIGNTGPENITLKSLPDGDYQLWVNYYRDWVIEDPNADPDPPTPISVTMRTYFNGATALDTETFTLSEPNYGADRPIGTTGPATNANWRIRKLIKVKDGKITAH